MQPLTQHLSEQEDYTPAWEDLGTRTGGLAFNIGANIGQAARLIAPNFDKVFAFEPCEESYVELVESVPANVIPVMMAVSDHVGTVHLLEIRRSMSVGSLSSPAALHQDAPVSSREVSCSTIDALVETYGVPDLIQMDVEGHEITVMDGAKDTIAQHHPNLSIEVHDQKYEALIRDRTPGYEWTVYHWPNLREHSVLWNHFWMSGTWAA